MFHNILKNLRLKNDLTQKELAKKINSSTSKVSMWEQGERKPTSDDLILLSNLFDVTIDYLLGKSSNPELTVEEEIDVARKFEELKDSLENTDELMFHGEILDEETRELLLASLQQTILTSKIISKEREKNKNNKRGGENEQRKTKS